MIDNAPLGLVAGLSNDAHHADPSVGSSFLKVFQRSPLHAWAEYLDPQRKPKDPKKFRIGRAWHCAVFEPSEFGSRYTADHDANKNTNRAKLLASVLAGEVSPVDLVGVPDDLKPASKEGKALYAEIEARGEVPVTESDLLFVREWLPKLQGRDVLPADTIDDVHTMAGIARSLPISRVVFDQLAEHVRCEVSMFVRDPATGQRLKIRPDLAVMPCQSFQDGLIIDGKSTMDASPAVFSRQVWNLDYGLQAAFYTRVYQQALKTRGRPTFLWLAQEKERPFASKYYAAGADLLAHYDSVIDALLPRVAECHRTGVWPGYGEGVETLAMPAWAQKQMQEAAA